MYGIETRTKKRERFSTTKMTAVFNLKGNVANRYNREIETENKGVANSKWWTLLTSTQVITTSEQANGWISEWRLHQNQFSFEIRIRALVTVIFNFDCGDATGHVIHHTHHTRKTRKFVLQYWSSSILQLFRTAHCYLFLFIQSLSIYSTYTTGNDQFIHNFCSTPSLYSIPFN